MITGLELKFMGVTWSNSGLFSTPGFIVSPWEKEKGGRRKKREGMEGKGIEKEESKEGGKKE